MSASKKPNLSVLIITLNEERHIKSLLENIDFADEIIVIDSFSKDKTVEIINTFTNVKLIQNQFINYTSQRNFALDQAKNDWILFIDADEKLTPNLKSEILKTIEDNNSVNAYLIHRTFMFKNKKLHFSGWQTDKIFRLFKKEKAQYPLQKIVHEKLVVNGTTGKLKNKLIHFSYKDYSSYKQKMVYYGKLKAIEEFNKGTKPSFFHFYIRPLYQFVYQYIIRLGIFDGKKGIIICFLNAYSVYIRFQELKKLRSNN